MWPSKVGHIVHKWLTLLECLLKTKNSVCYVLNQTSVTSCTFNVAKITDSETF